MRHAEWGLTAARAPWNNHVTLVFECRYALQAVSVLHIAGNGHSIHK